MDRHVRAPRPGLRWGTLVRPPLALPRAAMVALVLVLLLTGCFPDDPPSASQSDTTPAIETATQPAETATDGSEADAAGAAGADSAGGPEPADGASDEGAAGGGGSPVATPVERLPGIAMATPVESLPGIAEASPVTVPGVGSPPANPPPPARQTETALETATTQALQGASASGAGPPPPPAVQNAAAVKTAVAQGTEIPPPEQTVVAETAAAVPPPVSGETVVATQSATETPTEVATVTETPSATDTPTPGSTDTPTPIPVGAVRVRSLGEAGSTLLPDACVTLTAVDGSVAPIPACDSGAGDADPEPGAIQFDNVPIGAYTVTEDTPAAGYSMGIVSPETIEILADQTTEVEIRHPSPTPTPPEAAPIDLTAPVAFQTEDDRYFVLIPGDGGGQLKPFADAGTFDPAVTPAFSVDWRWLAFFHRVANGLVLFDLTAPDAELRPVSLGEIDGRVTHLAWSPRGTTLAVTVELAAGGFDLVLVDPEFGHPGRVFHDAPPSAIRQVEWAPNGEQLVVVSDTSVELVNASSLDRTQVVAAEQQPAEAFYGWSSTGLLLFRAGSDLLISDPRGTPFSLGAVFDEAVAPLWSEDGGLVAFVDAPADQGGQLRLGAMDGSSCQTGFVEIAALAWYPTQPTLTVAGARTGAELGLDWVQWNTADCGTSSILAALEEPVERLDWSFDAAGLAMIGPATDGFRTVRLLGVGLVSGVMIVDAVGWAPDAAVLVLNGDPRFDPPPAEARLWAVPVTATQVGFADGATTDGGFVAAIWLPPPRIEPSENDPAPRRNPVTDSPDDSSTDGTSGGGTTDQAPEPTTGEVEVRPVDQSGAPLPGACVVVLGFEPICDNASQYDYSTDPGVVLTVLNPGAYQIYVVEAAILTQPAPAQTTPVEIVAGTRIPLTLSPALPTPSDNGTGSETGGETGAIYIQWSDAGGQMLAQGCVTLNEDGPYCDGDASDQDPDTNLLLVLVPAGSYTVTESKPPSGYASASEPTMQVDVAGGSATVDFVNAPEDESDA